MKKLLRVVLVSSLLLVVTLAGASSPPRSTLASSRQQARILGRKARELGQFGHSYQHEGKHMQQPEEVVVMEAKKPAEKKAGRTDQGEDTNKGKGLIYSADYEGVAMHAGSPPKHKHPRP